MTGILKINDIEIKLGVKSIQTIIDNLPDTEDYADFYESVLPLCTTEAKNTLS